MGIPMRDTSRLVSLSRLRELLSYDPVTGHFTNLIRRSPNTRAGERAGHLHPEGYWIIRLDGLIYKAHRLAWFLTFGVWPTDQMDHINGDRSDNRIENLRLATTTQNNFNMARPNTNTSGFKGVHWHYERRKWVAQITLKGRKKTLGGFRTPEEAHDAYCKAAQAVAGEFFNPGVHHGR